MTLITSAKSPLPREGTYSQVPGLGCGHLWEAIILPTTVGMARSPCVNPREEIKVISHLPERVARPDVFLDTSCHQGSRRYCILPRVSIPPPQSWYASENFYKRKKLDKTVFGWVEKMRQPLWIDVWPGKKPLWFLWERKMQWGNRTLKKKKRLWEGWSGSVLGTQVWRDHRAALVTETRGSGQWYWTTYAGKR